MYYPLFTLSVHSQNTQIVQILCDIRDRKFIFKGNLLSKVLKPVEIAHEWIKTKFKYCDTEFYY